MHEMALVHDVLDVVLDEAEKCNASEVKAVYLTIGFARDVVEDLMDGLFKHLARGTVAANADLVIQRVPITVTCNGCGEVFHVNFYDESTWVCPKCHAERNYKLRTGMEYYISRIEVAGTEEQGCPGSPRVDGRCREAACV